MEEDLKIEWQALEYEDRERGNDWFWMLGIVVIAGATASFLFGNYFFSVFIVLAGIMLIFFARKKPDIIKYSLDEKGLHIRGRTVPFKGIKSFHVLYENPPKLLMHIEKSLIPVTSIPLTEDLVDDVRFLMLEFGVKEEEIKEHVAEKVMSALGF